MKLPLVSQEQYCSGIKLKFISRIQKLLCYLLLLS